MRARTVDLEALRSLVAPPPHRPAPGAPGALLVDKPKGWTSFDVVKKTRALFDVSKVGHAGTLDPMATGLLIVLVRRGATKHQEGFMHLDKTYTGTLRLGATTASYDAETPVQERRSWDGVTREALDAARQDFLGTITQHPPMYSAVKVGGERLYKKARRGETAPRPPRKVTVKCFEITGREGADVHFRVDCSKGTYIRSLAHDLGQALGCGAHLTALRRTAIGPFSVGDAWTIERLEAALKGSP